MNPLVTSSSPIFRTGPTAKRNNLHLNCDKSCEILFADSRRRRWHADEPPPLPGIARCRSLKMLGVIIGDDFSVGQHVQRLVTSSAQTHYALRVLRCHRLNTAALQHVYRATVSTQWWTAPDALDTTRRMHRRSMICTTTPTMSYSAMLFSGRTTPSPYDLYCVGGTLSLTQSINQSGRTTYTARSAARYPPRHNDTTFDDERTHCSFLSIRLSCLIVIFWYACCTKTLTNSCSSYLCSSTVVGLRYVI